MACLKAGIDLKQLRMSEKETLVKTNSHGQCSQDMVRSISPSPQEVLGIR